MQLAYCKSSLVFKLHIRCENCQRESVRNLDVPDFEGAPQSVDDLLDSNLLAGMRYCCAHCQCVIGRLFAVTPIAVGG